jgi:ABC-type nitrate/sulfonate/bicarbonate transport system ATPase subunit
MVHEDVLTVDKLSKSYGEHAVISNLSFSLCSGQRLALFAESGSGKTTLVKILAGIEKQNRGTFSIQDASPVTVFQEPRLFPFMTIEENVFLPFKARGKPITASVRQDYQRWLDVSGLGGFAHFYPYQLSGGMKQKTTLIRGLLGRPRFAVLDEPFQSIGNESKRELIKFMLTSNPDMALLLITHSSEEVCQIAQTALVFKQPCLKDGVEVHVDPASPACPSDSYPADFQFTNNPHRAPRAVENLQLIQ